MVSDNLVAAVNKLDIIDSGINMSDHLPVIMNMDLLYTCIDKKLQSKNAAKSDNYSLRWDKADLFQYYAATYNNLSAIKVPTHLCYQNDDATGEMLSRQQIDLCYKEIVIALKKAGSYCVPLKKTNFYKYWWDTELDVLKEDSIRANDIWVAAGRPRSGPVYEEKRKCKNTYKQTYKLKDRQHVDLFSDDLHEALMRKNPVNFWKSWSSKFKNKNNTRIIDGSNDEKEICNKFAEMFKATSLPNSENKHQELKNEFLNEYLRYKAKNTDDVPPVTVEDVDGCLKKLKLGKAAGIDGLTAEHLFYCHPLITVQLSILFNGMLKSGHVPPDFGTGIIIPLIKNTDGNAASKDNYRGITLSPVLSKLFELILILKFGKYLNSSDLQFAFKPKVGCSNAIFTLKSVVKYYAQNGSTVTLCALDISKAFDKVDHYALYLKLINRNVPVCFINLLISWYGKSSASVRWGDAYSEVFPVSAGVRQGGVLSPILFAVYMDDLINRLELSKLGCNIDGIYLGCLLYADDIILLSQSVTTMQSMLDICGQFAVDMDVKFNAEKSVAMRIGPRYKVECSLLQLCNNNLKFVDTVKYLGIHIKADLKFVCKYDHCKLKFFAALMQFTLNVQMQNLNLFVLNYLKLTVFQ